MGENRFLSHALAPAIKGNRFTGVYFLFVAAISTWPCRCLTRNIDEFLKTRVLFETSMDHIFRSEAIYLRIGFVFDRLGRTCQVEHPIDTPDSLF